MIRVLESQNGYKIKYNKQTDQYEVWINNLCDMEFDTEEQAQEWIDNKTDVSAEEQLKSIVKNAHRLSYNMIDKYLTWGEQLKADTDNTFMLRFKTKKDRVTAKSKCKKMGFEIISETDDDYSDTKTPYWLFVSTKF